MENHKQKRTLFFPENLGKSCQNSNVSQNRPKPMNLNVSQNRQKPTIPAILLPIILDARIITELLRIFLL